MGPATRLQWGVTYLGSLIDLSPQDAARLEQAAQGLLADIQAAGADAHQQRNLGQLQKLLPKLNSGAAMSFGHLAELTELIQKI